MEFQSGYLLSSLAPDEPVPLASLTKIMTLRLVWQALQQGRLALEQEVAVPPGVTDSFPAGASLMGLTPGQGVTIHDLIRGATIGSANDACVVLATAVAGSEAAFVKMMNAEASNLGLSTASFADSQGLSAGNKMSATDVAVLAQAYMREAPEALAYHSRSDFTWSGKVMRNYNGLLGSYPGADGLKTGYTAAAGLNLVATAERDGLRLIAVVLGVPEEVGDVDGMDYRDQFAAALLDWGYAHYARAALFAGGERLAEIPVYGGDRASTGAGPGGAVRVFFPRSRAAEISVLTEPPHPYAVAPVTPGTVVGEVVVRLGPTELGRVPLVVFERVDRGGFLRVLWDSLRLWLRRAFRG